MHFISVLFIIFFNVNVLLTNPVPPPKSMYEAILAKCPLIKGASEFHTQKLLQDCDNWSRITAVDSLKPNNVGDVLCLLYYDTFVSFCKNKTVLPNEIILPNLQDNKVDICRDLPILIQKIPHEHKIIELNSKHCSRVCKDIDEEFYLEGCVLAHYFANLTCYSSPVKAATKPSEVESQSNKNPSKTVVNAEGQAQDSQLRNKGDPINAPALPSGLNANANSLDEGPIPPKHRDDIFSTNSGGSQQIEIKITPGKQKGNSDEITPENVLTADGTALGSEKHVEKTKEAPEIPQVNTENKLEPPVQNKIATPKTKPEILPQTNEAGPPPPSQPEKSPAPVLPVKEDQVKNEENVSKSKVDQPNVGKDKVVMPPPSLVEDVKKNKDFTIEKPKMEDDMPAYGNGFDEKEEGDANYPSDKEEKLEEKKEKPLTSGDDEPVSIATEMDGDSYFFSYFMVVCVVFVVGYVGYHNRQKIMALLLEGKRGRRQSRGKRPNSANYHKLDSNLEEAITSSCSKNTSQVIY